MPVLVKDYQWSETKEEVFITVPLKGVKGLKTDIFCTEDYLKVRENDCGQFQKWNLHFFHFLDLLGTYFLLCN